MNKPVDPLDPELGYSFLVTAAAEARAASRRYWAKGGPADLKYPLLLVPDWPEQGRSDAAATAARKRRLRREGR